MVMTGSIQGTGRKYDLANMLYVSITRLELLYIWTLEKLYGYLVLTSNLSN